jgi:hypothetical protein
MVDRHSNCETDTWQNNTFVSANQGCIQANQNGVKIEDHDVNVNAAAGNIFNLDF